MAKVKVTAKGGEALKAKLRDIATRIATAKAVSVGFLEAARYPGGKDDKAGLLVAQVAFWNEFGTTNSPPRPFMRQTVATKSAQWGRAIPRLLKKHGFDARSALTDMGTGIKDQLAKAIVDFTDPENAASTKARKAFVNPTGKPLIDTGVMLRSIDFVVE